MTVYEQERRRLLNWSRESLDHARWWRTCGRGDGAQCDKFARWCYLMALDLARASRRANPVEE